MATLSGPMFEPATSELFKASRCFTCHAQKSGAHYNIFQITGEMDALRSFFPDGEANEMNFVLFSTSGVHGTYSTIEAIEDSLRKYPDGAPDDYPEDYRYPELTVLIVQPRIVCLRYGTVDVTLEDIPYLKQLRDSSWAAAAKIGASA